MVKETDVNGMPVLSELDFEFFEPDGLFMAKSCLMVGMDFGTWGFTFFIR
jgi:hypothetical protein